MSTPRPTQQGHNDPDNADSSASFGGQQIRTQTVIQRCPKCRHVIVAYGGAHCVPCARPMLPVRGRDA